MGCGRGSGDVAGWVGQMGTSDGYVLLEETFVHWFHWFQERSMKPHFLKIV